MDQPEDHVGKRMLLTMIIAFCLNPVLQGQDWSVLEGFDRAQLEGKWIVVSVEVNGKFTKAQIGQRPGDVISLSSDVNVGLPMIG